MSEKKKSMLEIIREKIEKSGNSDFVFTKIKDKDKRRVRFLTDMEDFSCVTMHDNFDLGVGFPCYKYFGRKICPFCDTDKYPKADGFRTRDLFVFSIYDYEDKAVKIMMEAANDCSPIPGMFDFYETHGTLGDRDYIISRRGSGFDTSYTLIPAEKSNFKGSKNFVSFTEDEVFEKLKDRYLEKMKKTLKQIKDGTFGEEPASKKNIKKKKKVVEDDFDDDED